MSYNTWYKNKIQNLYDSNANKHPINILNLGSGKRPPIERVVIEGEELLPPAITVFNADYVTFKYPEKFDDISSSYENILSFMEGCSDEIFDDIISCRFFEHIPWGELDYYLYQMYRILKPKGVLSFVVPDFTKLNIALEQLNDKFDYQKWITLNSEYFNEKMDPHSCLWTSDISSKLLEGEGFFNHTTVKPVTVDGRHWYIEVTTIKDPKCLFER